MVALRRDRASGYYAGTSLRRPPPSRDPERDPRLPLPWSPGNLRRQDAAHRRATDEAREVALCRELEARPGGGQRSREGSSSRSDRPFVQETRGSSRDRQRSLEPAVRDPREVPREQLAEARPRRGADGARRSGGADSQDWKRPSDDMPRYSPPRRFEDALGPPELSLWKKKNKNKKKRA